MRYTLVGFNGASRLNQIVKEDFYGKENQQLRRVLGFLSFGAFQTDDSLPPFCRNNAWHGASRDFCQAGCVFENPFVPCCRLRIRMVFALLYRKKQTRDIPIPFVVVYIGLQNGVLYDDGKNQHRNGSDFKPKSELAFSNQAIDS